MIAYYIIIISIYYIFPGIRLLYKSAISSSVFGGHGQIPGKRALSFSWKNRCGHQGKIENMENVSVPPYTILLFGVEKPSKFPRSY